MSSQIPVRRRPAPIWPEVLAGAGVGVALVLGSVYSILSRDPEADLGIPAQVGLAIAYCIMVGALCGLVVGLSVQGLGKLLGGVQSALWVRVLVATFTVVALTAAMAWAVPVFHSSDPLSTLQFFVSGAAIVILIEVARNIHIARRVSNARTGRS
jgi:hypothetical protein